MLDIKSKCRIHLDSYVSGTEVNIIFFKMMSREPTGVVVITAPNSHMADYGSSPGPGILKLMLGACAPNSRRAEKGLQHDHTHCGVISHFPLTPFSAPFLPDECTYPMAKTFKKNSDDTLK